MSYARGHNLLEFPEHCLLPSSPFSRIQNLSLNDDSPVLHS